MRDIKGPLTAPLLRLHCLDLAVASARLLGRADGAEKIAEQYYQYCMKGEPAAPPRAAEDDAGPVGGEGGGEPGKSEGGEAGAGGPASLRQAGAPPKT